MADQLSKKKTQTFNAVHSLKSAKYNTYHDYRYNGKVEHSYFPYNFMKNTLHGLKKAATTSPNLKHSAMGSKSQSAAKSSVGANSITSNYLTGYNNSIMSTNSALKKANKSSSGAGSILGEKAMNYWNSAKTTNMLNQYQNSMLELAKANNELNVKMNQQNNKFNADQAEKQRAWEQNMANTAHQREVADLKAAGLNPVLSAGGQGAATPTGSNATASNFAGADTSISSALASALSATLNANATMTAAQMNSQVNRENGLLSYLASIFASESGMTNAQVAALAQMYGADQSLKASDLTSGRNLTGTRETNKTSTKNEFIRGFFNFISSFAKLGKG